MIISLNAVFKKVPEGYVAYIEELPGANTQGYTLEETRKNLIEAIQMVLEANRELSFENLSDNIIKETFNFSYILVK